MIRTTLLLLVLPVAPLPAAEPAVSEEAREIHREALLIDGHNDLPYAIREKDGPTFRNLDLTKPQPKLHTDIARLKQGGVGAQFWAAWVPTDTIKKGTAVRMTLEQIDVIHELCRRYPDVFEFATSTADIRRIRKSGKIASLIGVEGGHSIDSSLGVLRTFHQLGVRYMTLTHSESLDWADSATDDPKANGLSPFGEEVVREMNRLGMMVDLSHVSPATMKAAIKVSKAPVIFSHSSARAVADHPRNVPDDVLKLVKDNGGVVMVNFFSGFIVPEGARAMSKMFDVSRDLKKKHPNDEAKYKEALRAWLKENDFPAGDVKTIADHIDHIVKIAGIDHVGLGSDFDGITKVPQGMEDVSKYPNLTQELLNRKYTKEQILKVLGGNLMRVFGDVERASAELRAQNSDLARKLAGVKFEKYSDAPGYSEGPTWRNGEVFFCSGALYRVDAKKQLHKYLEIGPAGTLPRADGHLLVADNKHRAILDVSPEGKVGVLADRHDMQLLRSLNDLTVDARGNIYWTDPEGSTPQTPVGRIYRLRPDGRVDMIGGGLMFPNGLDVDPASKFLYVIESQSKKILRYAMPDDRSLLGKPEVFYDLGGSGGDGCAFDAEGNLWVADFHRPDTKTGRITVLSPSGKPLAHLDVPAKVVSNIAFGGPNHDEIFCTTGDPPGVFHAKVGVKGFAGHAAKPMKPIRMVNTLPLKPHPEADLVRQIFKPENMSERGYRPLIESFKDQELRKQVSDVYPRFNEIMKVYTSNMKLLAEIKRLGGTAAFEVDAPTWLREIAGDDSLVVFNRFTEILLNENSDGHAKPVPKKDSDRVKDDWLKNLAGQDRLRRLELSGTAITSAGLVHLKGLHGLEILNTCLTAVDDRGFEHLAGLTNMKRMVICASKITGSGFKHLGGFDKIESINLHSAPASDEGLESIGKLKNIRRLEIVHTNVTDAGLKHLANLKQLRQLHIASHDTTANGLPFLSELKELYELDVYEKTASNATCEQIAKLSKLRKLMLITGTFDDAGVKSLANMDSLEEVTLNSAGVTDASIETIATWKHLRKLNLGGTKITPAGKKRLAEALPSAVIE